MSESSVTNSVAPSVDGVISFMTTCALSGDYEVTVGAATNSIIELQGADQTVSGLSVRVVNPEALDKDAPRGKYKILVAPNGYSNEFGLADDFPKDKWYVRYAATAAYLEPVKAFVMVLR